MQIIERSQRILEEIERVLLSVDEAQLSNLIDAILQADQIVVYGLGREGLAMRSFAMRLMHLGFNVSIAGDMTTPPIGAGDLFLVSCGPGYLSTVDALTGVAQSAGATVAMVTSQPSSPLPQKADLLLVISAQTMAENEASRSEQAMGSAFEQAMWVLLDAMVPVLQSRTGQSTTDLRNRHTNLE